MFDERGRQPINWNAELRQARETSIAPHWYLGTAPPDALNPYKDIIGKKLLECPGGDPRPRHDEDRALIETDCPGDCGGATIWNTTLHEWGPVKVT